MSRTVKIEKPRWTDPDDIAYLSFFGTLLHGLEVEEVRVSTIRFELKRRVAHSMASERKAGRLLLSAPARPVPLTDAQRQTLHSIASVSRKASYMPRALPANAELVTIEMTKVSDGKVPAYVRRDQ